MTVRLIERDRPAAKGGYAVGRALAHPGRFGKAVAEQPREVLLELIAILVGSEGVGHNVAGRAPPSGMNQERLDPDCRGYRRNDFSARIVPHFLENVVQD